MLTERFHALMDEAWPLAERLGSDPRTDYWARKLAVLYNVYTVLGDGNAYTVLITSDPVAALAAVNAERAKYAHHRHHAHGITDAGNPERGDIDEDSIREGEK